MTELCCDYLSVRCIWLYVLSCHVCISELIYTLQLPECQGTDCSKQAQNLKFKWEQRDSNPQPLSSKSNTKPFQMHEFKGAGGGIEKNQQEKNWEFCFVKTGSNKKTAKTLSSSKRKTNDVIKKRKLNLQLFSGHTVPGNAN